MRKAAAMLRCMPAAIVMVDNNMNIIEANDSFMRMFTGEMYEIFKARPDGLTGAAIDRIVEFSDIFRTILKTGKAKAIRFPESCAECEIKVCQGAYQKQLQLSYDAVTSSSMKYYADRHDDKDEDDEEDNE